MTPPDALDAAVQAARTYLASLPSRPVGARASAAELRAALGGPLPQSGMDAAKVVSELARHADGGIIASAGPRYFGFVVGGSLPAALATDWLVSAWDQNAGIYALSPAASVVEEIAVKWLLELFGLPATASLGFVTGCQMANATCLAAARHAVLRKAGWDVEQQGLYGAPE
ncbi:MAG TPA: pyridoxal-dependent decarboxylase, partial [Gemmatimonadales bacterium]|nr:pyridoxal-dependent decarboxylase [Gemmatimonadales bacterium]